MRKPMVRFPDAVALVISYLRPLTPHPVYSRVPTENRPATFVRIKRLGGLRASVVTDRPRMDIECWAPDEGAAWDLCADIRAYMGVIEGAHGDTVVYRLSEVSGPMWLPDSETGYPRYSFAVEFSTRSI